MKILFVVFDLDSHINHFPLAIGYLASASRERGYTDISIFNQDVYHYPDSYLTEYLDENHFDVVGISSQGGYFQFKRCKAVCDAINASKDRPLIVLGGNGPSPEPEYYMKKMNADFIVIKEGDISFPNLLDAIDGKSSFSDVKGIAWKDGEKIVINKPQSFIKDLDSIPFPAWDLFPMDHYVLDQIMPGAAVERKRRTIPMFSSRGCLYACNYCYRLFKGYRVRSAENIIEEMKILKRDYQIGHVTFFDDLLMSSEERMIDLCNALIEEDLDITWDCQGRLNVAKPRVLKLAKEAGCVAINYGIESMDQEVLNKMNKHQTVEEIYSGIEATIESGIHPGINIIFGHIGDTPETFKKGLDFLLKYTTFYRYWTIKPVTPFPGSPLYYTAIKKGLLKDVADFYENKHVNSDMLTVNFTDMEDDEIYRLLYDANMKLTKAYYDHIQKNISDDYKHLYFEKDVSFRGVRHR